MQVRLELGSTLYRKHSGRSIWSSEAHVTSYREGYADERKTSQLDCRWRRRNCKRYVDGREEWMTEETRTTHVSQCTRHLWTLPDGLLDLARISQSSYKELDYNFDNGHRKTVWVNAIAVFKCFMMMWLTSNMRRVTKTKLQKWDETRRTHTEETFMHTTCISTNVCMHIRDASMSNLWREMKDKLQWVSRLLAEWCRPHVFPHICLCVYNALSTSHLWWVHNDVIDEQHTTSDENELTEVKRNTKNANRLNLHAHHMWIRWWCCQSNGG